MPVAQAMSKFFHPLGLKGPAILQASLYWEPGSDGRINWSRKDDFEEGLLEAMRRGSKLTAGKGFRAPTTRFVEAWLKPTWLDATRPLSQLG